MELGPKQEQWLQALESGDYEQGRVRLEKNNRFCCLGVANKCLNLGEDDKHCLLHTYEELGLLNESGSFLKSVIVNGSAYTTLIGLNDIGSVSFKEIAAIIRKDPSNVFTHSV